jgi:hypothetical protein
MLARWTMSDDARNGGDLEEKTVALEDVVSQDATAVEGAGADEATPAKKKRRWGRIALYALGVSIALMIILVLSLGLIVKSTVDHVLPMITGTPCSMGSCSFNPVTGTIKMRNLRIGNPDGYGEKDAFVLKYMKVSVDVGSLFSDVVVVNEVTIVGMNVDIETKTLTETNLTDIKANIDRFVKKGGEAEEGGEVASKEEPSAETGKEKKIIIKLIRFEDNSITMGIAGKTAPVPMVEFNVKDVGVKEGGVLPAEAAFDIIAVIMVNVTKAASEQASDSLKKGAGSVVEGVKSLFGGGKKE